MPYDSKSDIWSMGCVLYEMVCLKPPFRAEDMEGLYKKVLRGYYPKIPTHYSQDLSNLIRALLQVSPHLRPNCDAILALPSIHKRLEIHHMKELDENYKADLLKTIKFPKHLHYLTDKLPKPNYTPLRLRQLDRNRFVSTLKGTRTESQKMHTLLEDPMKGQNTADILQKKANIQNMYLPKLSKENRPYEGPRHLEAREQRYKAKLAEIDREFQSELNSIRKNI